MPPALLGSYAPPPFKYGDAVMCEVRGGVIITGLTDAPIPWPIGKRPASQGRALVVYGALAEAVRRESAAAVCYWWGLSPATVWKFRKALGVGQMTEGTSLLKSKSLRESEPLAQAIARGRTVPDEASRRQKISAARKGKPRPDHVIDAMRNANLRRTHTDETKKRMSAAKKGKPRAPRKEWTGREIALLGEFTDAVVAERIGRSEASVRSMRRKLGREPADR